MLTAQEFADLAAAQVGKPYRLGAEAKPTDPDPAAFDCSELVEWLYARNGTPIGDLAASQYDRTRPVSGAPKTGDLVFLKNNPARWNGIGHVAIVTTQLSNGDWRVVEARGRAYGVVRSTLTDWRARRYFAGLRRFDGFALATKPTAKTASPFTVASYNSEHPGYGGNYRYTDDGEFLRTEGRASLVLLQEANETARNAIRKALGAGWLTWPTGLVSVLWPRSKWNYGAHRELSFGTIAARAMMVELTRRANGAKLYAVAVHIRPSAVTDTAGKLADVRKLLKWIGDRNPVVVGGDWNTADARPIMESAGFTLATPWADTVDKPGTQYYDAIYVRGRGIEVRDRGAVLNPGPLSDHKAVRAHLSVSKASSPSA